MRTNEFTTFFSAQWHSLLFTASNFDEFMKKPPLTTRTARSWLVLALLATALSAGCGSSTDEDGGDEQLSRDDALTAWEYFTAPLEIHKQDIASRAQAGSSDGNATSISFEADCGHDGTVAFDGSAASESGGPFILESADLDVAYDSCAPVTEFPTAVGGTVDWKVATEQPGEKEWKLTYDYDGDIEVSGDQFDGNCNVRVTETQTNATSNDTTAPGDSTFDGTFCGYDASELLGDAAGTGSY